MTAGRSKFRAKRATPLHRIQQIRIKKKPRTQVGLFRNMSYAANETSYVERLRAFKLPFPVNPSHTLERGCLQNIHVTKLCTIQFCDQILGQCGPRWLYKSNYRCPLASSPSEFQIRQKAKNTGRAADYQPNFY